MYYAGACVCVCMAFFFFLHTNRCWSMYVNCEPPQVFVFPYVCSVCVEGKLSTCVSVCVCVYWTPGVINETQG